MICPWQEEIRNEYDSQENSEKKYLSGWLREPELGRKFAALRMLQVSQEREHTQAEVGARQRQITELLNEMDSFLQHQSEHQPRLEDEEVTIGQIGEEII